ncbi:MAG TPA: PSD1 and planctomycete cytochrome C domain-containing protein [Pirellulales bacterium]|nr:PSD1 and planctomycete cytochrome C domain-containing protein [Pirellulales bacterium]
MRRLPFIVALRVAAIASCLASMSPRAEAEEPLQYNRDIKPILSGNCFFCHGPDHESRQAGLRLDSRDEAVEAADSGTLAIVPGKPEESEMIRRIFADDEDERMPPPDSHKSLTAEQKELLKRWVAEGAAYQTHWLYAPLERPPFPKVKQRAWASSAIDAFILAQLESKSIKPSREADRAMLLRRLSLDLIGLPPTPDEVAAFVADTRDDAYASQVDRLLASPHYGERMAIWWFDVARFTDTVGFHGDQNQRIFPYRDYVIDAFNTNKPFDQFTLEQLAGDLLPSATVEQHIATGFNRLNMMTREGGAQAKEYLAKYGAERVRTVGTTWLGSTLGCCECHDHKYDPFTARDFYSLKAFFADVKQYGVYSDPRSSPNPELKGFTNEYPFPPELEVPSAFLQREKARLEQEITELVSTTTDAILADKKAHAAFEAWRGAVHAALQDDPTGWATPEPQAEVRAKGGSIGKTKVEVTDEYVVSPIKKAGKDELTLNVEVDPEVRRVAAVRLELVPGAEMSGALAGSLPQQMVRISASVHSKGKSRSLSFYFADADTKEPRYSETAEVLGVHGGWETSQSHAAETQTSVWLLNPPVELADGETLTITIKPESALVPVRVSVSPLAGRLPLDPLDPSALVALLSSKPAANQLRRAAETYLISTAFDRKAFDQYMTLHRQWLETRGGKAWTMVTSACIPLTVRVLPRGNWQDESGPIVEPAVPHFLLQIDNESGRLATRVDLARWLCSKENPITPRMFVNRLWKQFFGNALSMVVDDLGAQGEPPSHPELLDWLAVEFRDNQWDVKHVVRTIVMSNTYRQDSRLRPKLLIADPHNRLLASQNPRRLEAEIIRDNALAIAGILNLKMGGPSVKPYQPPGYYDNLQFPNRDYVADLDRRQWRRGVYMHWQRTFLHPMLANFDAPAREECTANRTLSNTPQQALTLLNDPSMVEAARALADRLLTTAHDDEARLEMAYELALARLPRSQEKASLLKMLASQREHYRATADEADEVLKVGILPAKCSDKPELAAWTSVTRVILNLHETITRY